MPQDIADSATLFQNKITEKDLSAFIQPLKSSPELSSSHENGKHLPSTFVPGFHDEAFVRKLRYRKLGTTGMEVSAIAIGGGGLERYYGSLDEKHAIDQLHLALKRGLNYIHTAPFYGAGKSEALIGKALRTVPRGAYFIATKIGRYSGVPVSHMFDFSFKKVLSSVEESLKRLGVQYIDVLQVHDVEFAPSLDIILHETLPALDALRRSGKVRHLGITGYSLPVLREIVKRSTVKIDTVLSFCRYGLYNNDLVDLVPFFRLHGCSVINAAPLSLGLLSKQGPEDWHPACESLRVACRAAVVYAQDQGYDLERLMLKFFYNSNVVDITVASMVCVERPDLVSDNFEAMLEPMSREESIVLEDMTAQFFRCLEKTHWEGEPVARYKEALREEELINGPNHRGMHTADCILTKAACDCFYEPDEHYHRKVTI